MAHMWPYCGHSEPKQTEMRKVGPGIRVSPDLVPDNNLANIRSVPLRFYRGGFDRGHRPENPRVGGSIPSLAIRKAPF